MTQESPKSVTCHEKKYVFFASEFTMQKKEEPSLDLDTVRVLTQIQAVG